MTELFIIIASAAVILFVGAYALGALLSKWMNDAEEVEELFD